MLKSGIVKNNEIIELKDEEIVKYLKDSLTEEDMQVFKQIKKHNYLLVMMLVLIIMHILNTLLNLKTILSYIINKYILTKNLIILIVLLM